jgi:broad specificity phosphatase PhoE
VRLVLMRHGQTGSNLQGALDTAAPGAPLTGLGLRQADAAAPVLVQRGVVATWSSDLLRAEQTARPVAALLGTTAGSLPGLAEIAAGDLEMRTDPEGIAAYAEVVIAWISGELTARMPGSEDGREFLARYDAAVTTIAAAAGEHDEVVAVSHGSAIGTWTASRAANLPGWEGRDRLRNTGAVVLEGDPDRGWRLVDWFARPLGGDWLDEADPFTRDGEAPGRR